MKKNKLKMKWYATSSLTMGAKDKVNLLKKTQGFLTIIKAKIKKKL